MEQSSLSSLYPIPQLDSSPKKICGTPKQHHKHHHHQQQQQQHCNQQQQCQLVVTQDGEYGKPHVTPKFVNGSGPKGSVGNGSKVTVREKHLRVAILALLVLSFGLLACLAVSGPLSHLLIANLNLQPTLPESTGFTGICDTPQCVQISHNALKSGDFSLDPCKDFHAFACSKWQVDNPIQKEQLYHAANINIIRDRIDLHIKKLLEDPDSSKDLEGGNKSKKRKRSGPKSPHQTLRDFYTSCLNHTVPDEDAQIAELVDSAGGYWKKADLYMEPEMNLTEMIVKFLKMNAAPLFDLTLDIDARNRSRYVLLVELPRTSSLVPNLFRRQDLDDTFSSISQLLRGHSLEDLPDPVKDKAVNEEFVMSRNAPSTIDRQSLYKMISENMDGKKMEQLKSLMRPLSSHIKVPEYELNSDIADIAFIAASIQKLMPSQRTRKFWKQKNRIYNEYSVGDLQTQFNTLDWKFMLESLLRGKHNRTIRWDELKVYVLYPDYLRRLLTLVKGTSQRLLYNSMLMLFVRDLKNDLQMSQDEEKGEPRWKFCIQSTKSVFATELSRLYISSFPPAHLRRIKKDVEEVFEDVKESVRDLVDRSWADGREKSEALQKISTLRGDFLAPSFYFEKNFLHESLKGIQINPEDFAGNIRTVYSTFRKELYQLYWSRVSEDRATWTFITFPFIVNAFYIQQFNSIVIPLAFLTPPQYIYGAPRYVTYATLALSISHEILHSIDGSGMGFDANGKLHEAREEAKGFLHEKASCVSRQYSTHFRKLISFYQTVVSIQVDGNLTQNENLADIAGLQVAHNAYRIYREKNPELVKQTDRKLPSLNFTLDQIFYVAVAQAYCSNISPLGYIFLLEMDEHTPHPERINGMLMNSKHFSQAFQCSKGSPMNPEKKCSFWEDKNRQANKSN